MSVWYSGDRQIPSPESSAERPRLSVQRPFGQKVYMAGRTISHL